MLSGVWAFVLFLEMLRRKWRTSLLKYLQWTPNEVVRQLSAQNVGFPPPRSAFNSLLMRMNPTLKCIFIERETFSCFCFGVLWANCSRNWMKKEINPSKWLKLFSTISEFCSETLALKLQIKAGALWSNSNE